MPAKEPAVTKTPTARTARRTAAQGEVITTLPAAMTGRASAARTAVGDEPVFAYFRSLPQPQRGIAEGVDALAARTLPGLQRCVKWGMAFYGVGDGWCFSCGGFVGHVKLTFGHGTALTALVRLNLRGQQFFKPTHGRRPFRNPAQHGYRQ